MEGKQGPFQASPSGLFFFPQVANHSWSSEFNFVNEKMSPCGSCCPYHSNKIKYEKAT